MKSRYLISLIVTALFIAITTLMWTLTLLEIPFPSMKGKPIFWALAFTFLLPVVIWWQYRIYQHHTRMVLFLLDALENNDHSIRFSEVQGSDETRMVHKALNRVTKVLHQAKLNIIEQEKFYEKILDCVNTGVLIFDEKGIVVQHNDEAIRLLGMIRLTHLKQLIQIDERLMNALMLCKPGDKLHCSFSNERCIVNLSIRVSTIQLKGKPVRIAALNDINNELDEKEVDSWIRLTRVLTHEIMNSVTPITSLSDTLLKMATPENSPEEVRNGLQTIHATSKGLLSFVDSYRKFTRIPTPMPSLFYVKPFLERLYPLVCSDCRGKEIHLKCYVEPENLILYADEQLIQQVMTNLLKNAVQAIEEYQQSEGSIEIHACCDENEAVIIEVSNDGPSIEPEVAENIFIPFFTTKQHGNGVGLSVSRQIMRLSAGNITLLPGKPTTFRLQFN